MPKRETCLLAVACTFIGIVIGFLISPIKAGISCGNNNVVGELKHKDTKQDKEENNENPGN